MLQWYINRYRQRIKYAKPKIWVISNEIIVPHIFLKLALLANQYLNYRLYLLLITWISNFLAIVILFLGIRTRTHKLFSWWCLLIVGWVCALICCLVCSSWLSQWRPFWFRTAPVSNFDWKKPDTHNFIEQFIKSFPICLFAFHRHNFALFFIHTLFCQVLLSLTQSYREQNHVFTLMVPDRFSWKSEN